MTPFPRSFLVLPPAESGSFAASLRKTRLLLLRYFLGLGPNDMDETLWKELPKIKDLLTKTVKKNGSAVLKILGTVEISAPLAAHREGFRQNSSLSNAIAQLVLMLSEFSEDFEWEGEFTKFLDLENNRTILLESPAVGIRKKGRTIEISIEKNLWLKIDKIPKNAFKISPMPMITQTGLRLSLSDCNPLSMNEAHPEKSGNAISLGGASQEEWIASLKEACELIRDFIPEWWTEFPAALSRIMPVGKEDQMHLSASYKEAIGMAYLSLHPNPLVMAEAIIHETQHNKLNALYWLDPVLMNGNSEWTKSPVRPDMRPLNGVLLAAHAFVPVSALHHRMWKSNHPLTLDPGFHRRRKNVIESNLSAIKTLNDKAKPSPMGMKIMKGLSELMKSVLSTAE